MRISKANLKVGQPDVPAALENSMLENPTEEWKDNDRGEDIQDSQDIQPILETVFKVY
jgi:hypothetical protein